MITGRAGVAATLIVTSSWPRTRDEVAGTFVRADAIARLREGRVVVAAPDGPGDARGGYGLEVVDVPHAGLFGTPGAPARLLAAPHRIVGLLPFHAAVARLARAVRPDRVVAHWLLPAGAIACALDGEIEAIAHGGDVRLLEAMPSALSRAFLSRLASRARIRAVSPGIAARLRAMAPDLPVVVSPMPVAEHALETARAHGARIRARLGGDLHVVAARMVASKRIERAVPHIAARGGRLVLIGDGPERERLMREARRAAVEVIATGAVAHEQALAWIAAADQVIAPLARGEGAPTVVREAEALGVPVVVLA
ncbi:MAG: glycosyltransferase [Deltaproteobacteria bacterium]|nr:glycosyltransferase [Deltaproteobacteria bacterium]